MEVTTTTVNYKYVTSKLVFKLLHLYLPINNVK